MPTLEEASDLEAGRGGDRMVGRPRLLVFLLVVQMILGTNGIFTYPFTIENTYTSLAQESYPIGSMGLV